MSDLIYASKNIGTPPSLKKSYHIMTFIYPVQTQFNI